MESHVQIQRHGSNLSVWGYDFVPGEVVTVTYTTNLAVPLKLTLCKATVDSVGYYSCGGTLSTSALRVGPLGDHTVTASGKHLVGKHKVADVATTVFTLT